MSSSRKITFWNQEFKASSYWMLQQLSTTCFTLCGFSLTALTLIIGFYKNDFGGASFLVTILLISTALFLLAGEMSREAYRMWKFTLAETIYMFTSALLAGSLFYFVSIQPLGYDWRTLAIILVFMLTPIIYAVWRGIHNIYVIVQAWRGIHDASSETG